MELKDTFHSVLKFFLRVCVSVFVNLCKNARRELGLQDVMSQPTWVLGTELGFSGRAVTVSDC